MHGLLDFIIKPIGNRYNNTKKIGDKELIIKDLLDRSEIEWINSYHLQIIKKYEKKLLIEQRDWLNKICSPI